MFPNNRNMSSLPQPKVDLEKKRTVRATPRGHMARTWYRFKAHQG